MKEMDFPRVFSGLIASAQGLNIKEIPIVGTTSSVVLAGYFCSESNQYSDRPQLIITHDEASALDLQQNFAFFNPSIKTRVLDQFDVSPYSTLYPNYRNISKRINWLYHAQYSLGGEIFIAPIQAVLQKTIPKDILDSYTLTLHTNDDLPLAFLKTLVELGYQSTPRTEDVGQFCIKGGLIDIFSPAHEYPVRIELFGDTIDSMRFFNADDQRSLGSSRDLVVLPVREVLYLEENHELIQKNILSKYRGLPGPKEEVYKNLATKTYFHGIDFYLPYFYEKLSTPIDFFTGPLHLWWLDNLEIVRQTDLFFESLRQEQKSAEILNTLPEPQELYSDVMSLCAPAGSTTLRLSKINLDEMNKNVFSYSSKILPTLHTQEHKSFDDIAIQINNYLENGFFVFIAARTHGQLERIQFILDKFAFPIQQISIRPHGLSESIAFPQEKTVFLREEDFFGQKQIRKKSTASQINTALSDLKVGDLVVHTEHGVAKFDGLKVMTIQGTASEFIQLSYKDDDKLYLPVYRINLIKRFTGASALDKLGTNSWEKTKIKVKNHLRDVAADLLALYAKRASITRPPFNGPDQDYKNFEGQFPYDETDDQSKAVQDILNDLSKDTPMDRLICGDVGFGKTEVAMRAAFKVVEDKKQVAVLAPTTILAFQHLETFRKRFKNWPVVIESLSRFTSRKDAVAIVEKAKLGEIDILIGTHRLLSKDIVFKNLGLLIVDEEHKFGVVHKEKIKKMKANIDTVALSATPIPRTLNMSFMGIRDLSLINTPPQDRLPTRTFITKFEPTTIQKAVESEIHRGGQIFFLHNKVQSIYTFADSLKEILPMARIQVAHGQMEEGALEKTMLAFIRHEFDVLVCTTIIESGMDIPRANTIFIDRADTLGLSQLYQLRGRVGRSKERAYCYLIIPSTRHLDPLAQERLRAIQENVELGSGLQIAHRDLELRGAGNILGEEQAGHANAVGYELYLELLEDALGTARGEEKSSLEPEVNIRIPALIPDSYMPDIRMRITYYKDLTDIQTMDDLAKHEEALQDQFGPVPEPVRNLMGVLLIKSICKGLGIRDLSVGTKSISLAFTENTPLSVQAVLQLTSNRSKKYSLTPDSRLIVKTEALSWPSIVEELQFLEKKSNESF